MRNHYFSFPRRFLPSDVLYHQLKMLSFSAHKRGGRAANCPPVGGSSFDSTLYHGPARAYCGRSRAWEPFEDPVPRLVLFIVCQQALLLCVVLSAMLARAQTALLVPARTLIVVIIRIKIAVAQFTVVVAT
ncbi:hypothetical protein B0O99DRAFT_379002 [Bisporella sp. PMI_857]|nr:hypothetical protein B0O99DRAFT_379002 [Bisporella sp. PMI_857]